MIFTLKRPLTDANCIIIMAIEAYDCIENTVELLLQQAEGKKTDLLFSVPYFTFLNGKFYCEVCLSIN